MILSCKERNKDTQDKIITPKLDLVAEVPDLEHCESVVYDPERKVLYVSVQGGDIEKDGSIAKLSLKGSLLKADFITGLNNPKGIALKGDKLYVSDVTELVEIDLEKEVISQKYTAENIEFLNDVALRDNGEVFVSDMFTSSIYRLDRQGVFEKWMSSPTLENPNGLLILDDEMFIAAWGFFNDRKPIDAPQGSFLKLNLKTKKIEKVSPTALGNLDGIQVYDKNHFLISDWVNGKVLKVSKDGKSEVFYQTEKSVGDILYLPKSKILAMPINIENKVLIYKVRT